MPEDPRKFYESKDAPHSRLFIISPKNLTEEDFRKAFEPFGKIEDIFIVKDRVTGDNKGKYQKTFGFKRKILIYSTFFACFIIKLSV